MPLDEPVFRRHAQVSDISTAARHGTDEVSSSRQKTSQRVGCSSPDEESKDRSGFTGREQFTPRTNSGKNTTPASSVSRIPQQRVPDHKPITNINDPAFQQWMKTVAAMPAEKQVEAVAKKLQELNPGLVWRHVERTHDRERRGHGDCGSTQVK